MNKSTWIVVAAAAVLAGCAQSPERKIAESAAQALGGKDKIEAIKSITIEGDGTNPNLGQNFTPEAELTNWKVTEFKRVIDPANGRMRTTQRRVADFPFALATDVRQNMAIDGDVGYNVNEEGKAQRIGEMAAKDRRVELLHHPITIVRAALDSGSKLSNLRMEGGQQLIDITTAKGDKLTLAVDGSTNLPVRVISMTDQPNLGDVTIETTFSNYEDVNGVKMPKHLVTKIDRWVQEDIMVSKNTLDADAGGLAAPDAVKSAAVPVPPPVVVTAEPVGKGIWWMAGSGNHRSVLFEFDDHMVLFEVPASEARSKAVIDKARTVVPNKPLTHVIVSHHHFDHEAGLRAAVAEGLTVITYKGNEAFFKELTSRPHTIVPDELQKSPKPLKIETMDDQLTLKDKSMELRLYHVKDNSHTDTLIFGYVPRDKLLIQADFYDAGWTQFPWADNMKKNVEGRGLQVDKDIPIHGPIESYAQVWKTIRAKQSAKN